jgi:hypothetical protein
VGNSVNFIGESDWSNIFLKCRVVADVRLHQIHMITLHFYIAFEISVRVKNVVVGGTVCPSAESNAECNT